MKTKVVCPQCGAEFAIPETTHVALGVVLGADSNLGTIYPGVVGQNFTRSQREDVRCADTNCTSRQPINPIPTPKQMKASEKLAALAAAGVNVSNLFSMAGVTGEEILARVENGQLIVIPEDDPIFNAIMRYGTVPNNRLFRRWVMAQVFHMMTYKSGGKWGPEGFTAALNAKGFKYSWCMTIEEFRVQAKLEKNDPENFAERNRWFNKFTALKMCDFYLQELNKHINELKAKHLKKCKGVPYIRLRGRDVFVSDIPNKVINPLHRAYAAIEKAKNATALYRGVEAFCKEMRKCWFEWSIAISPAFKDAYKGAGAYFTMKNLILFHKASFKNGCVKLSQKNSMAMLEAKADEYQNEGWRLFGVMKKLIEDNNIDIVKKMREWQKK